MANFTVTYYDYTFTNLETIRDNFRDAVPRTQRMSGLSGGYDEYGTDEAPAEIGRVDVTCHIDVTDRTAMQGSIDAIAKMKQYGKQKLYFQPQGTSTQRWCYARVNSISLTRGPTLTTDLYQTVNITFQAPDPHWYENEAFGTIVASGTSTSGTITHSGNANAICKVTLTGKTAGSAVNPAVRRIVAGGTVDEVTYAGTVAAGSALVWNGRSKECTYASVSAYSSMTFKHPDWVRLVPGANVFTVSLGGTADGGTVVFSYYPTYV